VAPRKNAKPKEKKLGFISKDLTDVKEPEVAPEDEYDLVILKAEEGASKKGTKMATILIGFESGDSDYAPFFHYLRDPGDIEDEDQAKMAALEAKRFAAVFDLDDDWEVADIKGERGSCFVGQEVGSDDITRNRLKLPRLKD
jgi:hypothetical protein